MIVYDVEQLSDAWFEAHLGVPSASQFSRLVTPAKMEPSKQLDDWAVELAAERWSQSQANAWRGNADTDYGLLAEDAGRAWYSMVTGREVSTCGYIQHPEYEAIASPDGLVESPIRNKEDGSPVNYGVLEVTSCAVKQHVRCLQMDDCPRDYLAQCQGLLWVGADDGIEWVDLLMFSETLPSKIFRVYPIPKFQHLLEQQVIRVLEERDRYVQIIEEAA